MLQYYPPPSPLTCNFKTKSKLNLRSSRFYSCISLANAHVYITSLFPIPFSSPLSISYSLRGRDDTTLNPGAGGGRYVAILTCPITGNVQLPELMSSCRVLHYLDLGPAVLLLLVLPPLLATVYQMSPHGGHKLPGHHKLASWTASHHLATQPGFGHVASSL
jgi:hypothetical protein